MENGARGPDIDKPADDAGSYFLYSVYSFNDGLIMSILLFGTCEYRTGQKDLFRTWHLLVPAPSCSAFWIFLKTVERKLMENRCTYTILFDVAVFYRGLLLHLVDGIISTISIERYIYKNLFLDPELKTKKTMRPLAPGSRINHPKYGKGVITNATAQHYYVSFIETGIETIELEEEFEVIEALDYELDLVSFYEVESTLKKLLQRWSDITPTVKIADRWKDGTLILKPKQRDLAEKEIPIDTFFHKIVMVRDRLRVMEQKINSSELDDAAKVDLQQYITRIYGSLTTFNVLFKDKRDYFVGERSK